MRHEDIPEINNPKIRIPKLEGDKLMNPEKIRKRNSKICGSRIPNVNRFVFTRNSLSNGLLIQINVVNLRSEKRKTVFGFKLMPVDSFNHNRIPAQGHPIIDFLSAAM